MYNKTKLVYSIGLRAKTGQIFVQRQIRVKLFEQIVRGKCPNRQILAKKADIWRLDLSAIGD